MSTGAIGVVAALPEEIRPLQRRLQGTGRVRLSRGNARKGTLAGRQLVTLATGDGSERAHTGIADLLSRVEVEAVIAIGIAGGLSTDLQVGDVVVAEHVSNGSGEVPAPDGSWRARALGLQGTLEGAIHSHSEIAIDPVAKGRLWERTGGRSAQVVDLETASFARAAAARQIPYLALRAVSDSSGEALPLDFNLFRRSDGSSDRAAVTWYALRHPSIVPELMQLRERLRHCANRLATLIEEILQV